MPWGRKCWRHCSRCWTLWPQDAQLRVVVLAGSGKAFCAGHNLKEMSRPIQSWPGYQQLFAQCSRVMLSIAKFALCQSLPVCTAWPRQRGVSWWRNAILAVASTEASFATSGINYGLFCATPSVPLVRNLPIKQAMEMLLTGDLSMPRLLAPGLVQSRGGRTPGLDAELRQAGNGQSCQKPQAAVRMGKAMLYQQREMGLEAAYQLAGQTMALNMIDADAQEGGAGLCGKAPGRLRRVRSWRPPWFWR